MNWSDFMDVVINVNGMSCAHCERVVTDAIKTLNGLRKVEVHLSSGKIAIDYDQEQVSLEDICEVIEAQGYTVDR
jgi:copper chaperone